MDVFGGGKFDRAPAEVAGGGGGGGLAEGGGERYLRDAEADEVPGGGGGLEERLLDDGPGLWRGS